MHSSCQVGSVQPETEGICYFAEPVRHQRTPQAKALSVIALCLLLCQIDLIKLSLYSLLSVSNVTGVFYKTN